MSAAPKRVRTHLARWPTAATLTTWCGFGEGRRRRGQDPGAVTCRWDGGEIRRGGAFDCEFCLVRIEAELGRLKDIVGSDSDEFRRMRAQTEGRGCMDHSCASGRTDGIGTNGGCRCDERAIRDACRRWRNYALWLEKMR